jgi:hypothetical protein
LIYKLAAIAATPARAPTTPVVLSLVEPEEGRSEELETESSVEPGAEETDGPESEEGFDKGATDCWPPTLPEAALTEAAAVVMEAPVAGEPPAGPIFKGPLPLMANKWE